MILHSRITVERTLGTDPRTGDPLGSVTIGPIPADVQPLSTEEKAALGTTTTTRLRAIVDPRLPDLEEPGQATIRASDKVTFAGIEYGVDGDAELHHVNGRAHHLEITLSRQQG